MTAAACRYRPMREADLDRVAAIEATLYTHPWTRGNFRDSLVSGYSCWLVELDEAPCAYGVLMVGVDEAHLLNISVAQPCQGRGLGRALLGFFETRAREFSARTLLLEVRPSNLAARTLYRSAGFREISVRRNYYPAQGGREDAILMGKDL